jgi:eukaryotic-like serine/threonine-protein kinase
VCERPGDELDGIGIARRIDLICRQFEADWREGRQPRIQSYLSEVPEEARAALEGELVALARDLRETSQSGKPGDIAAAGEPQRRASDAFAITDAPTLPPLAATSLMPDAAPTAKGSEVTGRPGKDPRSSREEPATAVFGQDPDAPDPDRTKPEMASDSSGPACVRYFGDYELVREIARGGMGVVYRARQVSLNRTVALKMILSGRLASERDVQRFRSEAEAAAGLDHPGIVPIHEIGEHETQHYFSMGFVEGSSLAEKLAAGPIEPRAAALLVRQVAAAVQYAHDRGVIHRDLKPGNILLDAQGTPRVTDFGLAKRLDADAGLTSTGQVMGTPSYMPPEQAAGRADLGPTADVYSLGAVLYALLTGRPPFQAAGAMDTLMQVLEKDPVPVRQLNAAVPGDLETICLKCLEKEPARRYTTAQGLGDDLYRFLAGEPIVARPVGPLERAAKWARRRPAIAALSALVVLTGLVGFSGILWQWRAAIAARSAARQSASLAQANEKEARTQANFADRRLYDVNMLMIERAYSDGDMSLFRRLLSEQEHSPLGVDRRGFEWRYWNKQDRDSATVWRQPVWVTSAAFSADGKWLATGSTDRTITIRSVPDGAIRKTLKAAGPVFSVSFSPDGRSCGAASGNFLEIFGTDDGKVQRNFANHSDVLFLPDGRFAARISAGVAIYDRQADVSATILETKFGEKIAIGGDGKRLATAGNDPKTGQETAQVWSIADGKLIATLTGDARPQARAGFLGAKQHVSDVALSPDGQVCALSGAKTIRIWNVATRQIRQVIDTGDEPDWAVAFEPDGRCLVTAGGNQVNNRIIKLYDLETGRVRRQLVGHARTVSGLALSPDSRRLASTDNGGEIRLWDLQEPGPLAIQFDSAEPVTHASSFSLAFGDRGRRLVVAGGAVILCDPSHSTVRTTLDGAAAPVALAADGIKLVTADRADYRRVRIWNLSHTEAPRSVVVQDDARYTGEGAQAESSESLTEAITAAAISPDGASFAIGRSSGNSRGPHGLGRGSSAGGPVRKFEGVSGRVAWTAFPHRDDVSVLAYSPDGRWLASGSINEGVVKILDAATGREVRELKAHNGLCDARFSPDGRVLATSGFNDNLAKLWDVASWREVHVLGRHTGPVLCVAFSPDGERLATGGSDGLIEIWDVATGQGVLSLKAHNGWIGAIAFDPDGTRLASMGRQDLALKIWKAAPAAAGRTSGETITSPK